MSRTVRAIVAETVHDLIDPTIYEEAVALIANALGPLDVILPAAPGVAAGIRERTAAWKSKPVIVEGEAAK